MRCRPWPRGAAEAWPHASHFPLSGFVMPSTVFLIFLAARRMGPGGETVAPHLGQTSLVSTRSPSGMVAITRSQLEHRSRIPIGLSDMEASVRTNLALIGCASQRPGVGGRLIGV